MIIPRKAVAVMRSFSLSRNALLFLLHIKSGKITALRTTGAGTKNAFAKYFDFVFEPADSCGFFCVGKGAGDMDHLKDVKDYWDKRSHGFSDAINEEADSHLGEEYKERFRKLFGEKPLEILDDGAGAGFLDRKSTRLNSSHPTTSRMPSSA